MHSRKSCSTNLSMTHILGMLLIVCILSFGVYHITNARPAEAKSTVTRELSFKSISITSKDTLWSIAEENYTEEYGSIKNYIKEIKRCNSLTTDDIKAGSALMVPIYVSVDPS